MSYKFVKAEEILLLTKEKHTKKTRALFIENSTKYV